MMRTSPVLLLVAVAACSSAGEDQPPTLTITSPTRGTVSATSSVTVTGVVTDDGAVSVSINGTVVNPGPDGHFTADVNVGNGIGIIETHASDTAGHDVRDVRAVLAGTVGTTDGLSAAPLGAHVGPAALHTIGAAIGHDVAGVDWTNLAKQANPVYNNGGCLGATINITSVSLSTIDVALLPQTNSLDTNVTINNVKVKLHADYKVACIGGSTDVTISASKAHIHGALGVTVNAGKIATSLPSATVQLDNFSLDVSGLPSFVEGLFNNEVRSKIESQLTTIIKQQVPPLANTTLANLVTKPINTTIISKAAAFGVKPAKVELSSGGLFASMDTTIKVAGGDGGLYYAVPSTMSSSVISGAHGLGVAIAPDLLNQLFGGLHAADAFELSKPTSSLGPLAAILDDDAVTLDVSVALSPTVTTDSDQLMLSVGDIMVTTKDANGTVVQALAISLRTTLTTSPTQTGKLMLTVGTPEVHAQVIEQSDVVQRPLTDDQVSGIITSVWDLLGGAANDALGKLPMPAIAGVQLGVPAVSASSGFIVADIALTN